MRCLVSSTVDRLGWTEEEPIPHRQHSYSVDVIRYVSTRSNMFTYTSARNRRRQRRKKILKELEEQRQRKKKRAESPNADEDDEDDDRPVATITEILFPFMLYEDPNHKNTIWYFAKTQPWEFLKALRVAIPQGYRDWKSTFFGFWDQKGFITKTKEELEEEARINSQEFQKEEDSRIQREVDQVEARVRRNMDTMTETAMEVREQVRNTTGIKSASDLRKMVADGMTLLAECLKEFMVGYRKGRDEDSEALVNKYFANAKEMWEDFSKDDGDDADKNDNETTTKDEDSTRRRRRKKRRRIRKLLI